MKRILLAAFLATPAYAEPYDPLGTASVEINGDIPEHTLVIGGVEVITDYIVEVEQIGEVGGIPVLLGYAFGGGNVCEGSHFVVALEDNEPKLYGPADTCAPSQARIETDRITIWTDPSPTFPGATWIWTPEDGLEPGEDIAFVPSADLGWDDLASRAPRHPGDVLSFGEIATQIDTLLDGNRATYVERIHGLGSGEMQGDDFYGTSCIKLSCDQDRAMLFLDGSERKAYLAWSEGMPNAVRLAPADKGKWSADALRALTDFLTSTN